MSTNPQNRRIRRCIISAVITFIIMTAIAISLYYDESTAHQAWGTFVAGLIATSVIASIAIYQVDKWSLKKQSAVHLTAMIMTIIPLLAISGWFDITTVSGVLSMLVTFAGCGLTFWLVGYAIGTLTSKKQHHQSDN